MIRTLCPGCKMSTAGVGDTSGVGLGVSVAVVVAVGSGLGGSVGADVGDTLGVGDGAGVGAGVPPDTNGCGYLYGVYPGNAAELSAL